MNADIRSVFIHSPHRGERRKDKAVPAQCAKTALLSAGSAGIYGAIPAELTDIRRQIITDLKGALVLHFQH